ncbi:MAG: hypothetical protein JSS72_02050 [Armatimonadetes bacterium]|nr:hypothetical protein [Armatimonadota bacterium]
MKLAVLPFNAASGTKDSLARQIPNFATDVVRAHTGAEIHSVSYLQQFEDEGVRRAAFVNMADTLLEREWLEDLFKQGNVENIIDGLLTVDADLENFELRVRCHSKDETAPVWDEHWKFPVSEFFEHMRKLIVLITKESIDEPVPDALKELQFGTELPKTFLKFLDGYDTLMYLNSSQGAVVRGFDPSPAMDMLIDAVQEDLEFVAPYDVLIQLCRACAGFRLGTFEKVKEVLDKLKSIVPDDFKAYFAMGEIYAGVGLHNEAIDEFEKAVALDEKEPALLTRLGAEQMQAGMPVNAERNFRKALEMEGDEKPSAEYLAQVLAQTNRVHEIPDLWKSIWQANPQNAYARARHALALNEAGLVHESEKAFETALEELDENLVVKRYYAPMLAQKGDLDRAMDFYEDCLETNGNDIPTLWEYAQTLAQANRTFEIPEVLRAVLNSNPDPNMRAYATAWLIELEQPKRVEGLENARQKLEAGDVETAVRDIKAMRNWLSDYWKLWALLCSGQNTLGEFADAEESAKKLLTIFPGCEPGYRELMHAISMQEGRQQEAYDIMRVAAMNNPSSIMIHMSLALAAQRAGDVEQARNIKTQILGAVGENPDVVHGLAEIN